MDLTERAGAALVDLASVLDEEAELFRGLIDLGVKKRSALLSGDLDLLDKIILGEQVLLAQLGRVEERRGAAQARVAEALNIPDGEFDINSLIQGLPAELYGRYRKIEAALTQFISELKKLNEINTELINQSLGYIRHSLKLMEGSKDPVYYFPGRNQTSDPTKSKLLLSRQG